MTTEVLVTSLSMCMCAHVDSQLSVQNDSSGDISSYNGIFQDTAELPSDVHGVYCSHLAT